MFKVVALGSDHAGFKTKSLLASRLSELGFEVVDVGVSSEEPADYPDIAAMVCRAIISGSADCGILVCGTGIGMSIAANKFPGIYASVCCDQEMARLSRAHNNANVLALRGRGLPPEEALEIARVWLSTEFEGGRHTIRLSKVESLERSFCRVKSWEDGKGKLVCIDHPLIQHKLSIVRNKETPVKEFRELVSEIAGLMVYEITRYLPLKEVSLETPVAPARGYEIAGKKLLLVPILRAGLGMVEGITKIIPNVKIGHIGIYRDPATLSPVEYYCKLPPDVAERDVFILDPMLATGGSACEAITIVKSRGGQRINLVSLIGAPEGIERVFSQHPDVTIYLAAVDSHLNDHGYIVPGLGDAGDRLFGTK